MPVETPSLFAQVIQDHLELKQRNQELEPAMPLDRYLIEDALPIGKSSAAKS